MREKHGQAFQREVGEVVERNIECRLAIFQATAVHAQGQELILPRLVENAEKQQGSIAVGQAGRCRAGCEANGKVGRGRADELDVSWSQSRARLVATCLRWQAIVAEGGAEN